MLQQETILTRLPQSPPWVTGNAKSGAITQRGGERTIFVVTESQHELVGDLHRVNGEADRFVKKHTSAYCASLKFCFLLASENPYPGKLSATTWKLGCSGDDAVKSGENSFVLR